MAYPAGEKTRAARAASLRARLSRDVPVALISVRPHVRGGGGSARPQSVKALPSDDARGVDIHAHGGLVAFDERQAICRRRAAGRR